MKSIAAILALSLAACGGTSRAPAPPVPVSVDRVVPVPCQVEVPVCQPPAFDAARKEMRADRKVRLMRAEVASQADCVRLNREAVEACRKGVARPAP